MGWSIEPEGITNKRKLARRWRNQQLEETDWIVSITDHPQHSKYMAYRKALRNWPADADNFPTNKPTLGVRNA